MKPSTKIIGILLFAFAWPLQSQVTFVLESIPAYTPENDQIFISGTFNGWKPASPAYALTKNQTGQWSITLPPWASGSQIVFNFTRGSVSTSETDSLELVMYRFYTLSTADTVGITIYHWYDHAEKPSTATWNVTRLSDNFFMPQLDRTRGISLYLPPDYEESGKSYPVIYMHDGQNLFDIYDSFSYKGEWKVDETLNELASGGFEVPIVVAVDYDIPQRNFELIPWAMGSYGGEGDEYIDFLASTLKPFFDSVYRTLPGPENTCIMGSSLGGLISFYGAIKRPDVFGKAGIFSPSYGVSDKVWSFLRDAEKVHPMRLYQLAGSEEGDDMLDPMVGMHEMLINMGFSEEEIKYEIIEGGNHDELLWGSGFREAYLWLFPQATSSAAKEVLITDLVVFPNPAGNTLFIKSPLPSENLNIQIYTLDGSTTGPIQRLIGNAIDITTLPGGVYLLKIVGREVSHSGWFVKN